MVHRYNHIEQVFRVELTAGQTLTVEKLATGYTSRDVPADQVQAACRDELRRHAAAGLAAALDGHREVWAARWADADVIDGDDEATRGAVQPLPPDDRGQRHRPAGQHRGQVAVRGSLPRWHVSWDTEVFLPFFIYTQPDARAAGLPRLTTWTGPGRTPGTEARSAAPVWEFADIRDGDDFEADRRRGEPDLDG